MGAEAFVQTNWVEPILCVVTYETTIETILFRDTALDEYCVVQQHETWRKIEKEIASP